MKLWSFVFLCLIILSVPSFSKEVTKHQSNRVVFVDVGDIRSQPNAVLQELSDALRSSKAQRFRTRWSVGLASGAKGDAFYDRKYHVLRYHSVWYLDGGRSNRQWIILQRVNDEMIYRAAKAWENSDGGTASAFFETLTRFGAREWKSWRWSSKPHS